MATPVKFSTLIQEIVKGVETSGGSWLLTIRSDDIYNEDCGSELVQLAMSDPDNIKLIKHEKRTHRLVYDKVVAADAPLLVMRVRNLCNLTENAVITIVHNDKFIHSYTRTEVVFDEH